MTYQEPGTGLRFELRTNAPGFMLHSDLGIDGAGLCIAVFERNGKYLTSHAVNTRLDYNGFTFCCRAIAAERFWNVWDAWKQAKQMKPDRCTCAPVPFKMPELFPLPKDF